MFYYRDEPEEMPSGPQGGAGRRGGVPRQNTTMEGKKALQYPNIEAERARLGRTKRELADYLDINVRSLQNWQAGKGSLPAGKLCQLCDLFGCTADYLLGRSEHRTWDER